MSICTADGGPGNQFGWRVGNGFIQEGPVLVVDVTSALDGNIYYCAVGNDAGYDEADLFIFGECSEYVYLLHR